MTFSTLAGSNTSIIGGGGSSQTINFSAAADLVTFDGAFTAGSIMGGSGNDTLVFANGAVVAASTVVKLDAGDDSLVFGGNTISGQFGGGAGDDYIGGAISIGNSGVSFWGGSGNDTFNFTTITNAVGASETAYFWNEAGTDSIVLGGKVSSDASTGAPVFFGITQGAYLDISFGAGAIATGATFGFGGSTMSEVFTVHNNLVTFGFGASETTIVFSGGGGATLQGGVFESAAGTNIFSNAGSATGTANFGIAGTIPTFS